MKGVGLGVARVAYLAAVGAAFFGAAMRADPSQMGIFAIASAYAAMAAVAVNFGIDRMVLIRIAENPTSLAQGPMLRARRIPAFVVVVLAAALAAAAPRFLGAAAIIVTRLILNDLEAVALGRDRTGMVTAATLINGVVTGVGTVVVAPWGFSPLLWASAAGNALAVLVLVGGSRLEGGSAQIPPITWRECWPFGLMAVVGVIYLRCGMVVLAPRGVPAAAIASFAVAFKSFEILVAIRGALVQRMATKIIHSRSEFSLVSGFSRQLVPLSIGLGLAGIGAAGLCDWLGVLSAYPGVWRLVAIVAATAPLVMSHAVTSALIFSRQGTATTFLDSCFLAALALGAVTVAAGGGIDLVMLVTCVMEFCSFALFAMRFRAEWNARTWTLIWPVAASAALLPVWGWIAL